MLNNNTGKESSADREYRLQESRVRQALKRQGLSLRKSRSRNPMDPIFGGYMIVNEGNVIVAGELSPGRSMNLDEVEKFAREK